VRNVEAVRKQGMIWAALRYLCQTAFDKPGAVHLGADRYGTTIVLGTPRPNCCEI
jgi:hypothetical protein